MAQMTQTAYAQPWWDRRCRWMDSQHRRVSVELNPMQVCAATMMGAVMRAHNEWDGRERSNPDADSHIPGCIAELAVSIWGGIPYTARMGYFKHAPDIGTQTDVRSVPGRDDPAKDGLLHLPIHREDSDAYQHVLVILRQPNICILAGWIVTGDAKAMGLPWESWKRGHKEAIWVPQDALRPMSEIGVPL